MALLLLVLLLTLGLFISYMSYELEMQVEWCSVLLSTIFLAPIALGAFGAYWWLRTGSWVTITVADTLNIISALGIDTRFLLKPISWLGVQQLSQEYLESGIGWTISFVSMTLFFAHLSLVDIVSKKFLN